MKAEKTFKWIGGHHCFYSNGVGIDEVNEKLNQLEADSEAYNSPETQELIELGKAIKWATSQKQDL